MEIFQFCIGQFSDGQSNFVNEDDQGRFEESVKQPNTSIEKFIETNARYHDPR